MIRTIIVDDEPNSVAALQSLLETYCPAVRIAGTADSVQTAYTLITEARPELIFLDIEMPHGNAFELLNMLPSGGFEIVFVTAFNNYALNAIKYSALDYLLKPINIRELQKAVQKATERIEAKSVTQKIDTLLHNLKAGSPSQQKMALPTHDGLVFLNIEDFVWLEAKGNYTTIHLDSQRKIVVSKGLKEFEDILPAHNFSRIHQSFIINHRFIKKYHRGRGGYVEMDDGTTIEVSIRKKDPFLSKFK